MLCQSPGVQLNSSQDCKQLYQFLDFCQRKSVADRQVKIASITLEIAAVDPLTVLQHYSQSDRLHFYAEKREQSWSVVAIDAALRYEGNGSQRFIESQNFIQTGLDQLIVSRAIEDSEASPRFFCNFTFFDENSDSRACFSAATIFLPELQVIRSGNQSFLSVNLQVDGSSNLEMLAEKAERQFKMVQSLQTDILAFAYPVPDLSETGRLLIPIPFLKQLKPRSIAFSRSSLAKLF